MKDNTRDPGPTSTKTDAAPAKTEVATPSPAATKTEIKTPSASRVIER